MESTGQPAGERRSSARFLSRSNLVLIGFLAIAGYFLWTEHEAHIKAALPYLPYLLVLACPLLHIFMHGGHGGHGGGGDGGSGDGKA